MEEKKVLTEEEEEQITGGTSAELPFPTTQRVLCPHCKSPDVTAKALTFTENIQLHVLNHCNNCGYEWETTPKPVNPLNPN